MPFGLTNAPPTFQRKLDMALAKYTSRTFLVYIHDVVIFSRSVKEDIIHMDEILSTLTTIDISLKRNKCEFFHYTIRYLGHIIPPGKMEIDQVLTKWLREASREDGHTHKSSSRAYGTFEVTGADELNQKVVIHIEDHEEKSMWTA